VGNASGIGSYAAIGSLGVCHVAGKFVSVSASQAGQPVNDKGNNEYEHQA
jgi:hypothetical protein